MAVPVLAVAAVVGAGLQIYNQLNAASAQAEAQQREAALKNAQADELEQRQAYNEELMRKHEAYSEHHVFNDNGGNAGSLGGIMQLREDLRTNIETSRREASWKARMLRMGGEADMALASDIENAKWWQAAGTAFQTAGNFYSPIAAGKKPSTDTKDLPGVGGGSYSGYSDGPILGAGPVRQSNLPPGY